MNFLPRFLSIFLLVTACAFADEPRPVGVAKIDITPGYPVRLSGYGSRRLPHESVQQRIHAKALAFGSDADGPAVLVTVDNCGVPASMRAEVVRRLAAKTKVLDARFAISSSHTHCAPMLIGVLPNLFSMDIPPEHMPAIERYTRDLTDKIEQVALAALADRKPARLAWSVGSVGFAMNRRVATAFRPEDHELPVLRVTSPDGKVRAIFTSYACHCTTLSLNFIHGDWAGVAQEALEREFPGAIALTAIGCGADQNPSPRSTVELVVKHGESLAAEAKRLVSGGMKPIGGKLECRTKQTALAFDKLPTREEWHALAEGKAANLAYHAKKNLARLDRGEKLPTELPYLVQTWNFGSDLAMVFLPGEVVVDYGLRLKREFDRSRMWVNGYSNDVPCYIPSKRVLTEGGYEGATAMVYYDRPTKFAPDVEERIVGAVHEIMPKGFLAKTASLAPRAPGDALATIHTKPGLVVNLAVSEPLIASPVAIDWSADGRLWVVEMRDYPNGIDGKFSPGGDVKVLTDTDGDGRYDKASVFLDKLPFPTGVTAWGKGVLICAAPDIIYAEDTNGDGRADVVKKLFSGFLTDNYQARVNSLSLGLDNWIHGANGLLGGTIRSFASDALVDIRGRDFRMNPTSGAFEPTSGVTQQGRVRDDRGNWFGCSNSRLAFHFPLPDHYLRRNPHVPAPAAQSHIPTDAEPNALHPISTLLERFNNPGSANQTTSACGLGIYRDDLIADASGDIFTCEPVHNLVHRLKLTPSGATFEAKRAADEQMSEFLASTDHWFRPVQARTGPDGALWIVDMYRSVIEHPRWIPGDKLAQLDVRAGAERGRIYRVYPLGAKLRPIADLTKLDTPQLVAALDTPNGTTRDLVHAELLRRADQGTVMPLIDLLRSSKLHEVRLQAICVLDGLDALFVHGRRRVGDGRALGSALLQEALSDKHPAVRRHAIRLSEPDLSDCLKLTNDPDFTVRYQLALSLGEWDDPNAATMLGTIAKTALAEPWMRAAVLSSSARRPLDVLAALGDAPGRGELVGKLIATAAAKGDDKARIVRVLTPGGAVEGWQIIGLLHLQDALDRRKEKPAKQLGPIYAAVHRFAEDDGAGTDVRLAALRLFGRGLNDPLHDLPRLACYLGGDAAFQKAALDTLARSRSALVPGIVLADWTKHGPTARVAIMDALLGRDEWTRSFLDAIVKGTIAPADVPTSTRDRLAKHNDASIRTRAGKLLPISRTDRAAVIAKYQSVANLHGDAAKGATVFRNTCAICHSYLGQGSEVGPNVGTYRTKSAQDFLVAILDPNAVVEPRFSTYTVQLKDGRTLVGVISSESATSLVLSQPGGAKETILRSDIASLHTSPLSLMPEGLDAAIPQQDMADLIAFLKGGG